MVEYGVYDHRQQHDRQYEFYAEARSLTPFQAHGVGRCTEKCNGKAGRVHEYHAEEQNQRKIYEVYRRVIARKGVGISHFNRFPLRSRRLYRRRRRRCSATRRFRPA